MWIITRDGFVSLVQHNDNPGKIRARARKREHLADTFQLADDDVIDLGPNAPDYRWHADITREDAAKVMFEAVMELDYDSHVKEEVSGDDNVMYRAMLSCWTALYRLQRPDPDPEQDWWTPGSSAAYGQWPMDDDEPDTAPRSWRPSYTTDGGGVYHEPGDDIASRTHRLANAMLAADTSEATHPGGPDEPLVPRIWEGDKGDCLICDDHLNTGDEYVVLPEDATYGDPEGPAHVICAEDEGWSVAF